MTSNLEIQFLRRAPPGRVIAQAELLRLGQRMAAARVELRSDTAEGLVAHATVSYLLPSKN